MDYVLSAIDELALLEPLLVPIAKVSLAILVCIVAYVPIAVLALILNKAFKRQFDNATDFLDNLSSRFIRLRLKTVARTKRNLAKFYGSYSSIIPLETQSLTVTANAVQGALDSFEQDLERAPLLAADQEAKKTELVTELNNKLDELSTGNTSLRQINIPDLILDPEQETRKRSAKASLIIFLPLLIAVIAVNTVLLNNFFDSLFDGDEIEILNIDLPYAVVISLLFSLIEAGIGFFLGFHEKERGESRASLMGTITATFAWLVVLGLAFIEWFLYLMVSTGADMTDIQDAYIDGQFVEMFLAGWLSFLGPTIVLALFIFGHRVSTAYFEYAKTSDLERFKRDLDDRHELFSSLQNQVGGFAENIDDLLGRIGEANTGLNQVGAATAQNMEEFRNIFRQNRESIQDTLAIADQTEIPAPEIQRAKLNLEDTASFYRSKLIYLLMSLSSVIVLAISLPSGVADFLSFSISGGLQILVAVILCGLAFASGIAQTSAVDVVLTSDGTIARVIVERRDTFKIVGSLAIGAIAIFLLFLLHGGREIIQSPLPFTLGVVCLTSAFIGGRHLLVSISSWRAYSSYAITMLASVMLQISATLCSFAAVLFSMINPTLEGLSYPVRIFSRRPN